MRASRLRHLVEIQRNTPVTENALHEPTDNWVMLTRCRAEITPVTGREYFVAAQSQAEGTHRITVRYQGAKQNDRISWMDRGTQRIFDIKALLDKDMIHQEVTCMCVEHGNVG